MKKRMLIIGLFLGLVVGAAACGSKAGNDNENIGTNQNTEQENINKGDADKEAVDKDEENSAEAPKPADEESTSQKLICYYVDPETGNVISEEIESGIINGLAIWMELQNRGVVTDDCQVNNFEQNEEDKSLHLDVNKAFGDYVRGMGTAGETEVLKCVVNSYLDTYHYQKIKITEEGNVFETGHAVLDGYMGKQ